MRLSPRILDLFSTRRAEMPDRRPGRATTGTALAAVTAVTAFTASCTLLGSESMGVDFLTVSPGRTPRTEHPVTADSTAVGLAPVFEWSGVSRPAPSAIRGGKGSQAAPRTDSGTTAETFPEGTFTGLGTGRTGATAAVFTAVMDTAAVSAGPAGPVSAGMVSVAEPSCASGGLRAELTEVQHGAGQTHAELALVNTSGRACVLGGYPTVFQVDTSGRGVGEQAVAEGPDAASVVLVAGGRAQAGLTLSAAGLFPACYTGAPAWVAGLQVIPPGGRTALPVAGSADVVAAAEGPVAAAENPAPSTGSGAADPVADRAAETAPDPGCAGAAPTRMRVTALTIGG